jgi:hypothetical protein
MDEASDFLATLDTLEQQQHEIHHESIPFELLEIGQAGKCELVQSTSHPLKTVISNVSSSRYLIPSSVPQKHHSTIQMPLGLGPLSESHQSITAKLESAYLKPTSVLPKDLAKHSSRLSITFCKHICRPTLTLHQDLPYEILKLRIWFEHHIHLDCNTSSSLPGIF